MGLRHKSVIYRAVSSLWSEVALQKERTGFSRMSGRGVVGEGVPCKGTGMTQGLESKDPRYVWANSGRSVLAEAEKWKF